MRMEANDVEEKRDRGEERERIMGKNQKKELALKFGSKTEM